MSTPSRDVRDAVDAVDTGEPPMTPERWRAVDAILQAALACEPARRDAFVADACTKDPALQREVASLLAAHDTLDANFLERPAFAALALPSSGDVRRKVSALGAMYVAAAMLVVGLAGGWALSHVPFAEWWKDRGNSQVAPSRGVAVLPGTVPIGALRSSVDDEGLSLTVVDRAGRPLRLIDATRPWTPRFSPDGRFVAYGAYGAGRTTSDLWVTDLRDGSTRRLTNDDADDNDPQWSANGKSIAYSASAPGGKDVFERSLDGGEARVLASRDGTQFPSDWVRERGALLVTEEASSGGHDIVVQPADGSAPRPYAVTAADETCARISPDGKWVAYTSDESGRAEVYVDSYPTPTHRVSLTAGGGVHPVWRADGRELFYWSDGKLVAAQLGHASGDAPPTVLSRATLFSARYRGGVSTMYDVSPDGQRFVIVERAK